MASYPFVDSLGGEVYLLLLISWVDSLEWQVHGFLSLGRFLGW